MSCACSGHHCLLFELFLVKKGTVGITRRLLPAKMLFFPVNVLSLAGRLYAGGF